MNDSNGWYVLMNEDGLGIEMTTIEINGNFTQY